MFATNSRWIVVLSMTLFAMMILGFSQPADVHAAVNFQTADNSCLTCHEELYYLHDTGCWYCLSEPHRDRCTDCHEGNASAFTQETAHLGLLVHPQENNGEKCLECHDTTEAQARMTNFESKQPFDVVLQVEPYTPATTVRTGPPQVDESNPFTSNLGWLAFAFVMFGVWLLLALRS